MALALSTLTASKLGCQRIERLFPAVAEPIKHWINFGQSAGVKSIVRTPARL